MLNSRALSVVAGLAGTYLALSLMVLCLVEVIAGLMASRARFLRGAILSLVGPELGPMILSNGIVSSLGFVRSSGKAAGVPSYIPSALFARALLSEIGRAPEAPSVAAVKELLEHVVGDPSASLEQVEHRVAAWFDAAMDRLSGSYKRHTQRIGLVITVLLVVASNTDSIRVAGTLWQDAGARTRLEAIVKVELERCSPDPHAPACRATIDKLRSEEMLPLGLDLPALRALDVKGWVSFLLGLALSVLAVSRGAPFWFDALRRLTPTLSSAGPRPPPVSTPPLPPEPAAQAPARPVESKAGATV